MKYPNNDKDYKIPRVLTFEIFVNQYNKINGFESRARYLLSFLLNNPKPPFITQTALIHLIMSDYEKGVGDDYFSFFLAIPKSSSWGIIVKIIDKWEEAWIWYINHRGRYIGNNQILHSYKELVK